MSDDFSPDPAPAAVLVRWGGWRGARPLPRVGDWAPPAAGGGGWESPSTAGCAATGPAPAPRATEQGLARVPCPRSRPASEWRAQRAGSESFSPSGHLFDRARTGAELVAAFAAGAAPGASPLSERARHGHNPVTACRPLTPARPRKAGFRPTAHGGLPFAVGLQPFNRVPSWNSMTLTHHALAGRWHRRLCKVGDCPQLYIGDCPQGATEQSPPHRARSRA